MSQRLTCFAKDTTSHKPVDRLVYRVPEIAALLDINIVAAYELAKRPGFPAVKISQRRIVIPKEAFHQWLDQQAAARR